MVNYAHICSGRYFKLKENHNIATNTQAITYSFVFHSLISKPTHHLQRKHRGNNLPCIALRLKKKELSCQTAHYTGTEIIFKWKTCPLEENTALQHNCSTVYAWVLHGQIRLQVRRLFLPVSLSGKQSGFNKWLRRRHYLCYDSPHPGVFLRAESPSSQNEPQVRRCSPNLPSGGQCRA